MASTAERRAWLVANGHPELEGGVGRLSARLIAESDAGLAAAPPPPPPPVDDWGAGASEADFVAADDDEDYPEPPAASPASAAGLGAAAEVAEEAPQRPHRAGFRLPWHPKPPATGQAPAKPRRPGRKGPRVSVAPLIQDAYADIAWAAAGIPPLQRLLYAQAPIAGVILDPQVKDTFVDRVVLQAAARNYDRMKVGMALVGTPMMLMGTLATAPVPVREPDTGQVIWDAVLDEDGAPAFTPEGEAIMSLRMTPPTLQHQSSMIGLRYCVRAMADLSGDALRRVRERAAENAERDSLVDEFMAFILGAQVPPSREETDKQEGAAAGLRLAGAGG